MPSELTRGLLRAALFGLQVKVIKTGVALPAAWGISSYVADYASIRKPPIKQYDGRLTQTIDEATQYFLAALLFSLPVVAVKDNIRRIEDLQRFMFAIGSHCILTSALEWSGDLIETLVK